MKTGVITPRIVGAFGLCIAATNVSACRLDAFDKTGCARDADCLDGRQCVRGTCMDVPSSTASSGTSRSSGNGTGSPTTGLREAGASAHESGAGQGGIGPIGASVTICDATLGRASCGQLAGAPPTICFPASELGGEDFCADGCDPSAPLADRDSGPLTTFDPTYWQCVPMQGSGALLLKCHPDSNATAQADCPAGLSCYRTSIVPSGSSQGVCIRMPVCTTDADCPTRQRSTCISGFIADLLPANARAQVDHLNCIHAGCSTSQAPCPGSEVCLGTAYGQLSGICVSACDSALQCAPNYSCAPDAGGPGGANLCISSRPALR